MFLTQICNFVFFCGSDDGFGEFVHFVGIEDFVPAEADEHVEDLAPP
jgi:hypothetical protein